MAIYRFRVSFEDYDDVIREIDIKSTQTFEELHLAIHRTTGYNPEKSSSFYVSNDHWIKAEEIAFLPNQRKTDAGVALMTGTKLYKFIDDPHQKFYYTYNFERPYDLHVELIKILDEEKGKEYPVLVRRSGEAPKPPGSVVIPVETGEEGEFDFLNDIDEPDEEDIISMGVEEDDLGEGLVVKEHHEDEEEKDDIMDEFADNDNLDADEFDSKEDY
ncbi:hypothetical protein WG906_03885 [Pedobacter sp. P351]|uniref:IS1096 element passenger TnpR family protein n=1 Tax=Pedobacter superstes TaxID=3133441 RepID=UPI0030956E45